MPTIDIEGMRNWCESVSETFDLENMEPGSQSKIPRQFLQSALHKIMLLCDELEVVRYDIDNETNYREIL
jgi:hypothetical protein